jgi:hypothetical protein
VPYPNVQVTVSPQIPLPLCSSLSLPLSLSASLVLLLPSTRRSRPASCPPLASKQRYVMEARLSLFLSVVTPSFLSLSSLSVPLSLPCSLSLDVHFSESSSSHPGWSGAVAQPWDRVEVGPFGARTVCGLSPPSLSLSLSPLPPSLFCAFSVSKLELTCRVCQVRSPSPWTVGRSGPLPPSLCLSLFLSLCVTTLDLTFGLIDQVRSPSLGTVGRSGPLPPTYWPLSPPPPSLSSLLSLSLSLLRSLSETSLDLTSGLVRCGRLALGPWGGRAPWRPHCLRSRRCRRASTCAVISRAAPSPSQVR